MDITPLIRRNAKVIQAYKNGIFQISGAQYDHAVIVSHDDVQPWQSAPVDIAAMTLDAFASVFDTILASGSEVEVLLFGTGKNFVMVPLAFRRAFKERFGVTLDVMDSGAACRTFNVLMAEGRNVVAIMLPVV